MLLKTNYRFHNPQPGDNVVELETGLIGKIVKRVETDYIPKSRTARKPVKWVRYVVHFHENLYKRLAKTKLYKLEDEEVETGCKLKATGYGETFECNLSGATKFLLEYVDWDLVPNNIYPNNKIPYEVVQKFYDSLPNDWPGLRQDQQQWWLNYRSGYQLEYIMNEYDYLLHFLSDIDKEKCDLYVY